MTTDQQPSTPANETLAAMARDAAIKCYGVKSNVILDIATDYILTALTQATAEQSKEIERLNGYLQRTKDFSEEWLAMPDKRKPETYEEWDKWMQGWNRLKIENIQWEQQLTAANNQIAELEKALEKICNALPKDFDLENPDAADFVDNSNGFMEAMQLARDYQESSTANEKREE